VNPTPTPEPSKKEEQTIGSAVVNATKVALRAAPSTNAEVLTRVDKGERI